MAATSTSTIPTAHRRHHHGRRDVEEVAGEALGFFDDGTLLTMSTLLADRDVGSDAVACAPRVRCRSVVASLVALMPRPEKPLVPLYRCTLWVAWVHVLFAVRARMYPTSLVS